MRYCKASLLMTKTVHFLRRGIKKGQNGCSAFRPLSYVSLRLFRYVYSVTSTPLQGDLLRRYCTQPWL